MSDPHNPRERARELIERAEQVLAQPRSEGRPWFLPKAEEKQAKATSPTPAPYLTVKAFHSYTGALEKGIGLLLQGRDVTQALRLAEAERRITALEERLAALDHVSAHQLDGVPNAH